MNEWVNQIADIYANNANEELALGMKKYMKNHFEFFGIQKPTRQILLKPFFTKEDLPSVHHLPEILQQCWAYDEREMQYLGLTFLEKKINQLTVAHLGLVENLILEKSWWDTVDLLAGKIAGKILSQHPIKALEMANKWSNHPNFWINRLAILFQLKYKANTNQQLLFKVCAQHSESKEFFIQKAIGWVLREYAKTNPQQVINFVNTVNLAPLSKREALRIINKTNL